MFLTNQFFNLNECPLSLYMYYSFCFQIHFIYLFYFIKMWHPKFFAWPFLPNHYPGCFLTPSLSPNLLEQNLHITSKSHLSSIFWRLQCVSNSAIKDWVLPHQTKTTLFKLHLTTLGGPFLPAPADAVAFLLAPLWKPHGCECQIGKIAFSSLSFSLRCPQTASFSTLMAFIWVHQPPL